MVKERVRVAFVLNARGTGWMGGVNYMTNLLRAIGTCPLLQPVIFSASEALPPEFSEFDNLEFQKTSWVDPKGKLYFLRKSLARSLDRDVLFERFLNAHQIGVLSHYGHLGHRSSIPTIVWIPDFQHLHMPEFFDALEFQNRNRTFARIANGASIVLLSSESAQKDFKAAFPHAATRSRVLRFASDVGATFTAVPPRSYLETTYGLTGPYFHVPNQFWIHKNHSVVIDALSMARQQGRPMTVVATGHTEDWRNPDYFQALMQRARAAGCAEDFRVLGLVPYSTLTGLMVHATALINPSLFEGWSTTVEEAKSIGKRIILSDIPVHREQAPEHGSYFRTDDPEALMAAMLSHLDTFDQDADLARQLVAKRRQLSRFKAFGAAYEDIVVSLVRQI